MAELKLEATLFEDPILAVSADGRRAVSAMRPRAKYGDFEESMRASETARYAEVKLWDLGGELPPRLLLGHTWPVMSLGISSDGWRAISGSWGRLVRVWDLGTGTELWVLRGHQGIVWSVDIALDGRLGVSASEDSTVKVWDLDTGRLVATFTGQGEMATSAIAPDGDTIIARETSGQLHILRLRGVGKG